MSDEMVQGYGLVGVLLNWAFSAAGQGCKISFVGLVCEAVIQRFGLRLVARWAFDIDP